MPRCFRGRVQDLTSSPVLHDDPDSDRLAEDDLPDLFELPERLRIPHRGILLVCGPAFIGELRNWQIASQAAAELLVLRERAESMLAAPARPRRKSLHDPSMSCWEEV